MAHASDRQSFPVGTKYVLERVGCFVRRYIEFPNGRRKQLPTRKALTCAGVKLQTSIVPDHNAEAFGIETGQPTIVA